MGKKIISIPPRLDLIIALIIAAIMTLLMMIFDIESDIPISTNEDRMLFIILAVTFLTRWYTIYEECLTLKMMFIPIRKISWTSISGAFYLPAPKQSQTKDPLTIVLMLTPLHIEKMPKPEHIADFLKKNKRQLVELQLPPYNQEIYIEAIERCVGRIHHLDVCQKE